MSLSSYHKKRDFKKTKEPRGEKKAGSSFRFVVQRHDASHLHYDFRLELGGVLKSWAVPKGPSLNPADKRLAILVEDHPLSYISFKGVIPEGNYGAGTVKIWDKGKFVPVNEEHKPITEKQALIAIKNGELKFILKGKKLKGEFVLVRFRGQEKDWLLIKHKDEYAVKGKYDPEKETAKPLRKKAPAFVTTTRSNRNRKLAHFIQPMLATLSKQPPFDDKKWLFEIKWDGYRAIAEWNKKQLRFYSRNGLDFSDRFRTVAEALKKIKQEVVLDGEIVVLNKKGLPDFQMLQQYENYTEYPLIYYVFDLLRLAGQKTESLPLAERKKLLKKVLGKNAVVRYCDHVQGNGAALLQQARKRGLEGIIAKKADSTYTEGKRSADWLKLKNSQRTESVIVGYTAPRGGRKHFGSLVLANKKGKEWVYRGHVGTGFTDEILQKLKTKMKPLETAKSPFHTKIPVNEKVTWLKPRLVADIGYTEVTRDTIFRHPVFMRLREEKTIRSINDESMQYHGEGKTKSSK